MAAATPSAMLKDAEALLARGDEAGALKLYKSFISRHKDHPSAMKVRTRCVQLCVRLGLFDEAVGLVARAGPAGERDVDLRYAGAQAQVYAGRASEARAALEGCLAIDPDHGPSIARMAVLLMNEKRHDEAVALLDDARARGVDAWDIDHAFMQTAPRAGRAGEAIDRSRARVDQPGLSPSARSELWMGLAELYEKEKDYGASWDAVCRGNALVRRPWDRAGNAAALERTTAAFDASTLDALGGLAEKVTRRDGLVFVAGMPRSGTTLIEQIITAHPDASSAGEPGCLQDAAERCGQGDSISSGAVLRLSAAKANDAGAKLRAALEALSEPTPTIVDKRPFNDRYLGTLAAIVPGSRVILTERDPRDVALSCFFRNFAGGMIWSADMGDITAVTLGRARLHEHWHAVLPAHAPWVSLTRGRYETVVGDPENEARRLVSFAGLSWDDACLKFYEHKRMMPTLQPGQAGKGVYTGSMARWKRFEPFANGAFDGLHALGESMGYGGA